MLPVNRQLEELVLIRCSLLPGERVEFLHPASHSPLGAIQADKDALRWEGLASVGAVADNGGFDEGLSAARFRVAVDGATVSLEIDYQEYNGSWESVNGCIRISGDNINRAAQERWRGMIKEKIQEVAEVGGDFPIYQLLSIHLLPILHEDAERRVVESSRVPQEPASGAEETYHVLFTSHHLISATKRRNLQTWSSSLNIVGFAKIGYPGVIYAQGSKYSVEEFVENVKAMQWLALKVRFVEPLVERDGSCEPDQLKGWREFEKVGEVVQEMRRLGRGEYILEMGIGSGMTNSSVYASKGD